MIALLCLILGVGFLVTSLVSYFVSSSGVKSSIANLELPLTADSIYSEIQKDLIRPFYLAAMMSGDTFLRTWVMEGEKPLRAITQFLAQIKETHKALNTYFVSDLSENYYLPEGIHKKISLSDNNDSWFYRLKAMDPSYETNVAIDDNLQDALTIFINHKVLDFKGRFIGVAGLGLSTESIKNKLIKYGDKFQGQISFIDKNGKVIFSNSPSFTRGKNLNDITGLSKLKASILRETRGSFEYTQDGTTWLLDTRKIPELNWILLVEKAEDPALAGLRNTLLLNMGISLIITLLVIFILNLTLGRYQRRLEEMATTDSLTGLYNREAFRLLIDQTIKDLRRSQETFTFLMIDIDKFKTINDTHGHLAGDQILKQVSALMLEELRESDLLCRWGGDEFLVVLKKCTLSAAIPIAEKLRALIEKTPLVAENKMLNLTLSLGASQYRHDESLDIMLDRADKALYEAKNRGRNQVMSEIML